VGYDKKTKSRWFYKMGVVLVDDLKYENDFWVYPTDFGKMG
jgi:hypothetical protein